MFFNQDKIIYQDAGKNKCTSYKLVSQTYG